MKNGFVHAMVVTGLFLFLPFMATADGPEQDLQWRSASVGAPFLPNEPPVQAIGQPIENTPAIGQPIESTPAAGPSDGKTEVIGVPANNPAAVGDVGFSLGAPSSCESCRPNVNICPPCRNCDRLWFRGEYLYWWTRGQRLPPLATTSTSPARIGVLGSPTTVTVFGGGRFGDEDHSGARFSAGYWFDAEQCWGIQGSFFWLENDGSQFVGGPENFKQLYRPVYDVNLKQQRAFGVVDPNLFGPGTGVTGRLDIQTSTELFGGDFHLVKNLWRGCCWRVDGLLGYRFMNLDESLRILDTEIATFSGFRVDALDQFDTDNEFHGVDLGLQAKFCRKRWYVTLLGRVALGVNNRTIDVSGSQTQRLPGSPAVSFPVGVLALGSNVGRRSDTEFAAISEVGVNLGYQFTKNLRGFAGYSFIFWPNVFRPGDQVDLAINPNQLPPGIPGGPGRPAALDGEDDFYAHGLNFGLELSF